MTPRLGDPSFNYQKQVILGSDRLRLLASTIFETLVDSSLLSSIRKHTNSDGFVQDVLDHILPDRASGSSSKTNFSRKDYDQFSWRNGLLFRNNILYVPDGPSRLQVLKYCHDNPMAGHFGINKTLELVSRNYWWPKLREFVQDYVHSCDVCSR